MDTKRMTRLALLTSVALIIFIIELHIPNLAPVPGIKLGLANIITVYAMYKYSFVDTALVVFTRILLGTVFSGNISAIFYSIGGSVLCMCGMFLLRRVTDEKYLWISSVIGAVLHNTGQIMVAVVMLKTTAVFSFFPFLLISGCIAGAFTGICAQILCSRINL